MNRRLILLLTVWIGWSATAFVRAQSLMAVHESLFESSSKAFGVDVDLLRAIAWVESRGDATAVSSAGAIGVMQLMPGTAALYARVDKDALFQPTVNIPVAAAHLADLWFVVGSYFKQSFLSDKEHLTLVAAAYNAGWYAVKKYGGVPPYKETQRYVQLVVRRYSYLKHGLSSAPAPSPTHVSQTRPGALLRVLRYERDLYTAMLSSRAQ